MSKTVSDFEILVNIGNNTMPVKSAQNAKRLNFNRQKNILLSQVIIQSKNKTRQITENTAKKPSVFKSSLLLFCLLLYLSQASLLPLAFAQTLEPPAAMTNSNESLQPEGQARGTDDTVPNPYVNAKAQVPQVNQAAQINTDLARRNVSDILVGERTSLVYQAAEQGSSGVLDDVGNILNASLGSVNETYRGLHQFYKDDIVGRLFAQVGQLIGKWIQELINGWIADTVQFLAKVLRIFVLNPNIAINGLNGSSDDQISPKVRQAADIMYGIAVDLLLLLFILAIWKYWAEASWRGGGNLMGAVGRLIFTAGLILAWPTLFAFEVQITNEMIKAIYFNSASEIIALDAALASAVKGGLLAGLGGVMSAFAPIIGGAAGGIAAGTVGEVIGFFGLVTFLILGGILIAELVYILILKAIQTALLTAQYMFGPIFLVFFATPDTENVATGYVKSFVETSLWTFVWVGLLKLMVIILASDFNPWGKILMAIGILQMMIQVPSFLARAQISPMSDFISAGLVTGGLLKMLGWMGSTARNRIGQAVDYNFNQKYGARGISNTSSADTSSMAGKQESPELLNTLSKKTSEARAHKGTVATPLPKTPTDPNGQALKVPLTAKEKQAQKQKEKEQEEANLATEQSNQGKDVNTGANPTSANPAATSAAGANLATGTSTPASKTQTQPNTNTGTPTATAPAGKTTLKTPTAKDAAKTLATGAALAAGAGAAAAGSGAATGASPNTNQPLETGSDGEMKEQYQLPRYGVKDWDEKYFKYVPARFAIAQLTSLQGLSARYGETDKSYIVGDGRNGTSRMFLGKNASDTEIAHTMMAGAFANSVHDPQGHEAARQSAIEAGADAPKGLMENVGANWLAYTGSSFKQTGRAKERFGKALYQEAAKGSMDYVNGKEGNAYTGYLKSRFGDWTADNDAVATFILTDPESTESPWNRAIGPATDALISGGFSISPETRGAAQNPSIMAMHPARRKLAIPSVLKATFDTAKDMCKDLDPKDPNTASIQKHVHGELARGLSSGEVEWAIAVDPVSAGADLNLTNAHYGAQISLAAGLNPNETSLAYRGLVQGAPMVAQSLGKFGTSVVNGVAVNNPVPAGVTNLDSLAAHIIPSAGETREQAYAQVMEHTVDVARAFNANGIPMRQLMDPGASSSLYSYIEDSTQGGLANIDQPQGQMVLQAAGATMKQLGSVGFNANRANATYQYLNNGGNIGQLSAQRILVSEKIMDSGTAPTEHMVESYIRLQADANRHNRTMPAMETVVQVAQEWQGNSFIQAQDLPVVSQLKQANVNVNQNTLRVGAIEYAGSGNVSASNVTATVRLIESGVARNASDASAIFNVAAEAISGTGLSDLPPDLLSQAVIDVQRSGGFTDRQLQDKTICQMAIEEGFKNDSQPADNVVTLQCLAVGTRVHGASSVAQNRTEYIEVYTDMLQNGYTPYQAIQQGPQAYSAAEAIIKSNSYDNWDRQEDRQAVHATPRNVSMLLQDPRFTPNSPSQGPPMDPGLWDRLSLPRERPNR
jgi:hypothetical protein